MVVIRKRFGTVWFFQNFFIAHITDFEWFYRKVQPLAIITIKARLNRLTVSSLTRPQSSIF